MPLTSLNKWKINPLELTKQLINCPSITPNDAGIFTIIEPMLAELGFDCKVVDFGEEDNYKIRNLYAKFGNTGSNLCFSGHTDVVPAGSMESWLHPPFFATVIENKIYGRGSADMKSAIACFIAAASSFIELPNFNGSISLLITNDEEGDATYGTKSMLQYLMDSQEKIDACLVGEPTSNQRPGDVIKIGRRGSLNCTVTFSGVTRHVAYPSNDSNPLHHMALFIKYMKEINLDEGDYSMSPSNIEFVDCYTNNVAGVTNVTPGKAVCRFNIRFNQRYTGQELISLIESILKEKPYLPEKIKNQNNTYPTELKAKISGEAFIINKEHISSTLPPMISAIKKCLMKDPILDTGGGTSDARFFYEHKIPTIECGMCKNTIHQPNEHVALSDIMDLTEIYYNFLRDYFKV